jgi:hypothetical protein
MSRSGESIAIVSLARNWRIRRPFLHRSACCYPSKENTMKNLILAGLILAGLAACTTSPPPAEPAPPASQSPAEAPPPAPVQ